MPDGVAGIPPIRCALDQVCREELVQAFAECCVGDRLSSPDGVLVADLVVGERGFGVAEHVEDSVPFGISRAMAFSGHGGPVCD